MKVKKLKEEKLLREYEVVIPADDINVKIDSKLNTLRKKVNLPGFRKGKVPLDIIKKKYKDEVLGEVLQEVIDTTAKTAIKDNNLKPAIQPSVEITSYKDGEDLTYKVSLEVLPEVPEVKFEKIKLKKFVATIQNQDIDEVINEVANNYKDFKPYENDVKSKSGDAVQMDFEGFVDGVAFPGGKGEDFRLELGSNTFIPGFEDQLIGLKKGANKRVKVTFPQEYHSKDLAGKNAEFEVKIHDILEPVKTEINDEFAKKIGQKDIETLRSIIKSNLEQDSADLSLVLTKKELFDELEKIVKFDLPGKMVDNELNQIVQQIKSSADYNHDHVHTANCDHSKDDEKLKKEYAQLARRRVLLGILVTEVAQKQKIQITNEEINRALLNEASRYRGEEQKVIDFYRKNPQAIQALSGPIIEDKVVSYILTQVKTTEENKSLKELRELVLENNKE